MLLLDANFLRLELKLKVGARVIYKKCPHIPRHQKSAGTEQNIVGRQSQPQNHSKIVFLDISYILKFLVQSHQMHQFLFDQFFLTSFFVYPTIGLSPLITTFRLKCISNRFQANTKLFIPRVVAWILEICKEYRLLISGLIIC